MADHEACKNLAQSGMMIPEPIIEASSLDPNSNTAEFKSCDRATEPFSRA
jgi:hypothetical protein